MSADVIPFAPRAKNPAPGGPQHSSGPAFCLQCAHEWEAVAETGAVQLECPSCKTMKGLFKYPSFFGSPDTLIRTCGCGNQLFYITPQGHLCPNCGIYQSYD